MWMEVWRGQTARCLFAFLALDRRRPRRLALARLLWTAPLHTVWTEALHKVWTEVCPERSAALPRVRPLLHNHVCG